MRVCACLRHRERKGRKGVERWEMRCCGRICQEWSLSFCSVVCGYIKVSFRFNAKQLYFQPGLVFVYIYIYIYAFKFWENRSLVFNILHNRVARMIESSSSALALPFSSPTLIICRRERLFWLCGCGVGTRIFLLYMSKWVRTYVNMEIHIVILWKGDNWSSRVELESYRGMSIKQYTLTLTWSI